MRLIAKKENGLGPTTRGRIRSVKPHAFLIGALALFLFRCLGTAAELSLQSPLDFQVFQRAEADKGVIKVRGDTEAEAPHWQYRLAGRGREGAAVDETWRDFPAPPQNGAFDFSITASAGGWYRLEVRAVKDGQSLLDAAVEHVGVGEVFLVAGQSNAGNYGAEKQQVRSGNVSSFDGRKWMIADDPQPGAGGEGGSFMPAFGDGMAERFHVPIGLVPVAAGGTSVRAWLPAGVEFAQQTTRGIGVRPTANGQWESTGALFEKLAERLAAFGPGGCRAVLWHQGESDAGQARGGAPADQQITGAQYAAFMETLIRTARERAHWSVPWFSAQATYHSETDFADEEFRAAQKAAWDKGLALPGPDTDALRGQFRAGVHFKAQGLQKHGALWVEKVAPWLETQLSAGQAAGPRPR
jgi:Carbohydrate esterase, sialic acid-specific acetylesterase